MQRYVLNDATECLKKVFNNVLEQFKSIVCPWIRRNMAAPIGVTVCRSDGVAELTQNNQVIVNGPKTDPDSNGRVYQKLGPDDAKEFDWRKKLGTALMNHLNEIEPGKIDTGRRSYDRKVRITANDTRQRICFKQTT